MKEGELLWFKDEKAEEQLRNLPPTKELHRDDLRYDELALEEMAGGIFTDETGKVLDGVMTPGFYQKNVTDRIERLLRVVDQEEGNKAKTQEKKRYLEDLEERVAKSYEKFIKNFPFSSSPDISEDMVSLN